MDKNTIIGFVLIALILVGFSVLNRPSEEEIAKQKRYNDSIALVNQAKQETDAAIRETRLLLLLLKPIRRKYCRHFESCRHLWRFQHLGFWRRKVLYARNELVKLTFSNKGGRICSCRTEKIIADMIHCHLFCLMHKRVL
jgi:YidC/Oxa1 family membrane protein insertase